MRDCPRVRRVVRVRLGLWLNLDVYIITYFQSIEYISIFTYNLSQFFIDSDRFI